MSFAVWYVWLKMFLLWIAVGTSFDPPNLIRFPGHPRMCISVSFKVYKLSRIYHIGEDGRQDDKVEHCLISGNSIPVSPDADISRSNENYKQSG
jgi:hypothetical protein